MSFDREGLRDITFGREGFSQLKQHKTKCDQISINVFLNSMPNFSPFAYRYHSFLVSYKVKMTMRPQRLYLHINFALNIKKKINNTKQSALNSVLMYS